jgi:hypothetical protein
MKDKFYNFTSDGGHGWAKISLKELHKLGIAEKISHYSYMRKGFAYLEEDCDMTVLYNALGLRGITMKLRYSDSKGIRSSKIRNYDSYDASKVNWIELYK